MIINAIEGSTRVLGKAQGYRGLWIRDEAAPHGPQMVSSWQPTNAELIRIQDGAPVLLTVLGSVHPPVLLEVGLPPQPALTDLLVIEDLLDRLDDGVQSVGMHDDNATELFDVEGATDTMAEAAKTLRDLIHEFSGDPEARRADRDALIDRWLKPAAKPDAPPLPVEAIDGDANAALRTLVDAMDRYKPGDCGGLALQAALVEAKQYLSDQADAAYRASLSPEERAQLDFSLAMRNGAKVALPKDKQE